ncbi:MAG: hypothetical protein R3C59_17030 [Planctomycetaceae bacterium]
MKNQTLKCVDARHLVHLSVGDDTQPDEEQQLSEHLHVCSDCRAYHAGMVDAMHVLERVRDDVPADMPAKSIWPGMAAQLKARRAAETVPERRRFNVSVAALCACSLLLALVTAVQNLPSYDPDPFANLSVMPATNVSFQNGRQWLNDQNRQPLQLLPVRQDDGTVVFVDASTGQMFVPNMIPTAADGKELNF